MSVPSTVRIQAEDYYQLPVYSQTDFIQLIDGNVITPLAINLRHQAIVGEILFLLMTLARRLGGKAFTSPIEVYLDEYNIYEPDVLYLTPDSQCIIEDKHLRDAPELVVEVLSPSTAKHDRQEKYITYEKHGVHEYWIVDPAHDTLEMWVNKNGTFERQGVYGKEDSFQSSILGEEISLEGIFAE